MCQVPQAPPPPAKVMVKCSDPLDAEQPPLWVLWAVGWLWLCWMVSPWMLSPPAVGPVGPVSWLYNTVMRWAVLVDWHWDTQPAEHQQPRQ